MDIPVVTNYGWRLVVSFLATSTHSGLECFHHIADTGRRFPDPNFRRTAPVRSSGIRSRSWQLIWSVFLRLGLWVETSKREKPLLQLSEEALVGPLGKVGGRRAGAHPRFQRSLEKIDQISSERVDLRVQIVCLVAPAFGGGVSALGFRRGATRRRIPEPPCRGKRDLRLGFAWRGSDLLT